MKIAFRVDASVPIGAGHIARCLTLANELRACGAACHFLCRHMPESLAKTITANGHGLTLLETKTPAAAAESAGGYADWLGVSQEVDAEQTAASVERGSTEWLIVDHYALDRRWEIKLRDHVARILVIDDFTNRPHACDLLINQNLATADSYEGKVPSSCRVLCGPRYAMLRPEFREAHDRAIPRFGTVRRILVFFGGFDPANHTMVAIEAVGRLRRPDLQVDVVVGADNPNRRQIQEECRAHGMTLHVQTARMADLMVAADLAIGAGGSANWERCCTGVPSLVIAVAENQRAVVSESALAGVAYAPDLLATDAAGLERHLRALIENPALLQALSRNARNLVDGNGTRRVLNAMGLSRVVIRDATKDDSRNLFEWRNDPDVRAMSRVSSPLDWSTHSSWLDSVLADRNRILLIGERDGEPVGVVRFDVADDRAEVSIYKVPGRSERGIGADLLVAAENWFCVERPDVRYLDAEVLGQNRASHALFVNADYTFDAARYTKKVNR